MTHFITSTRIQIVNFTVGFALLAMLCPHHGQVPLKPAGVRTAIEMIAKKPSLRPVIVVTAAAV